jgi:hypothetical protein
VKRKSKEQIAAEMLTCPPREDGTTLYETVLAAMVPNGDMETEEFTFCHTDLEAENMAVVIADAVRAAGFILPTEIVTEWGFEDNFGPRAMSVPDETAEKKARDIVRNMHTVGREAHVVWRGVTEWVREQ